MRRVTLEAPRRLAQAGIAQVEKGDLWPLDRQAAAVKEVAGADADVEMRGADVPVVEIEEVPFRAPPDQAAREAKDEEVVEGEPCRRVDGDAGVALGRLGHRASLRQIVSPRVRGARRTGFWQRGHLCAEVLRRAGSPCGRGAPRTA